MEEDTFGNAMLQKYRVVGEYVPSGREILSSDGQSLLCDVCGKPKYESTYSPILRRKVWSLARNDSKKSYLYVGDGCNCTRDRYLRKRDARDYYDNPEFEKNGDKIVRMIHGRRNFAWDYGMDWMQECVPSWGRFASIEDRFYMTRLDSTPLQAMRLYLESISNTLTWDYDMFLYGGKGTLKTSMLCCMRYALLSCTIPTIMLNMRQLIFHLARAGEWAEKLERVDNLIIDDFGKATLTDRQSRLVASLLRARDTDRMHTCYGSSADINGLRSKGYGEDIIATISRRVEDPLYIDMEGK